MSKRLLVMNVHYAPYSFGGATIVAEEVVDSLREEHGWDILVLTTHVDPLMPPYSLRRYVARDCNILSINMAVTLEYRGFYDNPRVNDIVHDVLDRFQPDLVHCHAIQNMGCSFFDRIKEDRVPLVVTVHDSWWLCERQFMIEGNGRFCYQKKISTDRCRYCVNDATAYEERFNYLHQQLSKADLILAPSQYQCDLYRANGFDADKCQVNLNGIVRPKKQFRKNERKLVSFGFIGGPGDIKGSRVIVNALDEIGKNPHYQLLVVDAAQNVGSSWRNPDEWRIPGKFKFHPAYNQKTIDEFFAKIDVLLFPSQWRESFGLTVREALARDVWVIGTGEGGVGEAIEDGVNGRILPLTPDPQYLQAAIEECLEKRAQWAGYENPLKSSIRYFDEQAGELNGMFAGLLQNES